MLWPCWPDSLADCHSVPSNEPEHEKSLATGSFGTLSWCYLLSRWKYISTHWCNTWAATFLYIYSHFTRTQLKSLVPPVKCLLGEKLMNSRARHALSGFWPTPAPLHSLCLFPARMEWQLVTVGAPQYSSDLLTIVELRGKKKSIKVFLSLSFTLFSLFSKQRINQLYPPPSPTHAHTHAHTHIHDSLLFPSICLFSSQWSFRLDMYCEKLSCSASFFFSLFHSLSLSTVCHQCPGLTIYEQRRRRKRRVRDELMDGRISTQCPFFKDLLLYSNVSQSFLVGVSVWKPIHVLFCMGKQ